MSEPIDLETRLRDRLAEEAGRAPAPREPVSTIRRTRRRQGALVMATMVAVVALAAGTFVGVRSLARPTIPASPTVERSMHGVTMNIPEGWRLVDPVDAVGEPPSAEPPKLIAILTEVDARQVVGCPGATGHGEHGFVLTIQEEPLALTGPNAARWPVELSPLDLGTDESACYPGWEFLRAGWTAAGRTFEARIGIGPGVDDADRRALVAAYDSMSFAPSAEPASSVVLATGTTAGEDWSLTASRDGGGLTLGLDWSRGGTGTGFAEPVGSGARAVPVIQAQTRVFGDRVVVFGFVRSRVTHVELFPADGFPAVSADVIGVPDGIDPDLDAFVVVGDARFPATVNAYDAGGATIGQTTVSGGGASAGQSASAEASPPT
jgi:hypothetical protein